MTITDGGWLWDNHYVDLVENPTNENLAQGFAGTYDLQTITHGNRVFYYRNVTDKRMLSSAVFDVASFVSAMASTVFSSSLIDHREIRTFSRKVDTAMKGIFGSDLRLHWKTEKVPIPFSAMVCHGSRVRLFQYITGSSNSYFRDSTCKTAVQFEMARKSPINDHIDALIPIVDDSAKGYSDNNKTLLNGCLSDKSNSILEWSQRGVLQDLDGFLARGDMGHGLLTG